MQQQAFLSFVSFLVSNGRLPASSNKIKFTTLRDFEVFLSQHLESDQLLAELQNFAKFNNITLKLNCPSIGIVAIDNFINSKANKLLATQKCKKFLIKLSYGARFKHDVALATSIGGMVRFIYTQSILKAYYFSPQVLASIAEKMLQNEALIMSSKKRPHTWGRNTNIVVATIFFALCIYFVNKITINIYMFLYFFRTIIGGIFILKNAPKNKPFILNTNFKTCTILIPLYKESKMINQIIASILAIKYPRPLLDVKLILEANDFSTIAMVQKVDLPEFVHVVIVPKYVPQTKPKALNYASFFAVGEIIGVYDAEDVPDALQVSVAIATLCENSDFVAVQCRLSAYNSAQNFISRAWAIEYHNQFRLYFPAGAFFGWFCPLGGTSNFIWSKMLQKLNFWDAYNVTEDFDLAVQISLLGKKVGFVNQPNSTTLEEAPHGFYNWIMQRTRWIKGFIISISVNFLPMHTSIKKIIGFYLFGWMAIAHPIMQPLFIIRLFFANGMITSFGAAIFVLNSFLSTMLFESESSFKGKRANYLSYFKDLAIFAIFSFIIIIPFARAIWQIFTKKISNWEKTNHTETIANNNSM